MHVNPHYSFSPTPFLERFPDVSGFMERRIWIVAAVVFALFVVFTLLRGCFFKVTREEKLPQHPRRVDQKLQEMLLLSEQGSDRFGAYVTGNDIGFDATKKEIVGNCPENGAHIGCSGWHNLDLMCVRRSKRGIIVDFGLHNQKFIELTHELLLQAPNREIFIESVITSLNKGAIKIGEDIYERALDNRLRDQLKNEESWLGRDSSFEYIQSLFKEGKIISISLSFTDKEKLQKMKQILETQKLTVDTVYLCNVRYFIDESQQELFATSLNHIVADDTLVIHCPHVLDYQEPPPMIEHFPIKSQSNSRLQSVIRGKDLITHPTQYFVRLAKNPDDKNRLDLEAI